MKKVILKSSRDLCYTISKYNKPKLKVDPGETILIETEDAMSGQVRKIGDHRDYKKIPDANPTSGPIYVNGAEKGDALVVEIKEIKPRIGQAATFIWPGWWLYVGHVESDITLTSFLGLKLPERLRILPVKSRKISFDDAILPYEPMIGTIGTAPRTEAISTLSSGPHGGNMDLPCITTGATVYLPIMVEGALLHVGDAHAIQGDIELTGTAAEMPAEITLKVSLQKGKSLDWPRVENNNYIMALACSGSGRSLDEAIRIAYIYLIRWMEERGVEKWNAYELCGLLGKVIIGNIANVAVGFPKKYLHIGKKQIFQREI